MVYNDAADFVAATTPVTINAAEHSSAPQVSDFISISDFFIHIAYFQLENQKIM